MFNPLIYWRDPPDPCNKPQEYAKYTQRSDFLMSFLPNYVKKGDNILELGCNCGRNLNALYLAGYKYLSGVDINTGALKYGATIYPNLYSSAEFYNESFESWMKTNPIQYDCIFTMAVLEHIPPASDWIFVNLANKVRHIIIAIEDEHSRTDRHFPRNYYEVFDKLGWRQIFEKQATKIDELEGLIARVFTKKVINNENPISRPSGEVEVVSGGTKKAGRRNSQ